MLRDLIREYSIIHIAGREYRIRYSLNALLCLEMRYKPYSEILKTPFDSWSMEDILQLIRAAMCDLPRNKKAVISRDFDAVKPDLQKLGQLIKPQDLPLLRLETAQALINSMPQSEGTAEETSATEGHIHSMYVDIMQKSEGEFWSSTYKELDRDINYYSEVKGLKKMPKHIQMYDD